jgi:hypothetical protein
MVPGTTSNTPAHQIEQSLMERSVIGDSPTGAVSEDTELRNDRCHRRSVIPDALHSIGGQLFLGADRTGEVPAVNEEVANS